MKYEVEPIRSVEDIERLKEYFNKYDKRYYTLFMLGIYSGLRVSDITALDVSDVRDKSYVEVKEQKTGKVKRFPLSDELQRVIREYLLSRESDWCLNGDALFIGKKHGRIDRSQVWRVINKAIEELGIIGNYGTHTMRKTFGYHHYKQNHDVAMLQKIFNHSSPSITLRYIGIEQEEIDKSYQAFSYDYGQIDEQAREDIRIRHNNRQVSFKDIENSLEYLLKLYKKLDKKFDMLKVDMSKPKENPTVKFLKDYLESGDKRFVGFVQRALECSER